MAIGRRSTSISALVLAALLGGQLLLASDHQGQVRFGDVTVQGAAVQATYGETTRRVLTDAQGQYVLPDLADGTWTIQVEMPGFEVLKRDVPVTKDAAASEWSLRMLPLAEISGLTSSGYPKVAPAPMVGLGVRALALLGV
jgi:hypothetical protein